MESGDYGGLRCNAEAQAGSVVRVERNWEFKVFQFCSRAHAEIEWVSDYAPGPNNCIRVNAQQWV